MSSIKLSDMALRVRLDNARQNVKNLMTKVSDASDKVNQATIELYHYQDKLEEAKAVRDALSDEYNQKWTEGM